MSQTLNARSQEMVNLLLVGRAVPNVFDGVKDLDGLVLTGIHAQVPSILDLRTTD